MLLPCWRESPNLAILFGGFVPPILFRLGVLPGLQARCLGSRAPCPCAPARFSLGGVGQGNLGSIREAERKADKSHSVDGPIFKTCPFCFQGILFLKAAVNWCLDWRSWREPLDPWLLWRLSHPRPPNRQSKPPIRGEVTSPG